jgi:hypothetical protein
MRKLRVYVQSLMVVLGLGAFARELAASESTKKALQVATVSSLIEDPTVEIGYMTPPWLSKRTDRWSY